MSWEWFANSPLGAVRRRVALATIYLRLALLSASRNAIIPW
jgi:hypothetical protein